MNLSLWLKKTQKVVLAIKLASAEITACKDPEKRWKALQELRKLQNMIV